MGTKAEEFVEAVKAEADIAQVTGESICTMEDEIQCLLPRARFEVEVRKAGVCLRYPVLFWAKEAPSFPPSSSSPLPPPPPPPPPPLGPFLEKGTQ